LRKKPGERKTEKKERESIEWGKQNKFWRKKNAGGAEEKMPSFKRERNYPRKHIKERPNKFQCRAGTQLGIRRGRGLPKNQTVGKNKREKRKNVSKETNLLS